MNPSASSELIVNAQSIRARLRNPSNAVRDDGIDLKRLPRGFGLTGERKRLDAPIQLIRLLPAHAIQIAPMHEAQVSRPPANISTFFISRHIINHVAQVHGLTAEAIKSHVRTNRLVKPRQLAMHLMRALIPCMSLPWIGRQFNRDHTTVMHGLRKIQAHIDSDFLFATKVATLQRDLKNIISGGHHVE